MVFVVGVVVYFAASAAVVVFENLGSSISSHVVVVAHISCLVKQDINMELIERSAHMDMVIVVPVKALELVLK